VKRAKSLKVWRTALKDASSMMPERRKEIWRDQAARSRLLSQWVVSRARTLLMGSLLANVVEGCHQRRREEREVAKMSDNDLKYLTREEAEQIIERFEEIPQSYGKLLFWTGIPRKWAQRWADDHGMLMFSSAMGPLMDSTDKRCLRRIKKPKKWSKYIRGACGIFARYACKRGIVRVLTLPPYWAEFIRPQSTYRNIEEPVLKGKSGCCGAVQINAVYLLETR
jgi:hypothetical protein